MVNFMKKILIIDDSALMRKVLSDIIESDENFCIEATAENGLEGLELILKNPKLFDVIILDINMPKMNGIEFLKNISNRKVSFKVIVVSTVAKEGAAETIRCLELGVFDFITKPDSFIEAKGDSFKNKILHCIHVATLTEPEQTTASKKGIISTESPVVKTSDTMTLVKPGSLHAIKKPFISTKKNARKLVALACSTGGPKALQQVVPLLPKNLAAPVLIVQHMPEGFTNSLAQRLDELSNISVKEAANDEVIRNGVVYIAKGGSQLRLKQKAEENHLSVTVEDARNGLKPCADIMYESLLNTEFDEIICVVLTGMGADGTLGIYQLNDKKNIYVISQDKETCTVYGMPKVLAEAGLCDEVVPLNQVADAITKIVGVH